MSNLEVTKIWVEIVQGILTSVGIVGAGIWSLFVFGLGRNFAPNIKFQFAVKQIISFQDAQAAILSLGIKNIGRTRVKKEACTLVVISITPTKLKDQNDVREFRRIDPTISEIISQLPRRLDIFSDHDAFEPSEEAIEDILLELGESPILKVVVTFFGSKYIWGRQQQWTSSTIVDVRNTHVETNYQNGAEI